MTQASWSQLLRPPAGPVDLTAVDPRATPGFTGKKADGQAALLALEPTITDLQERLYAHGRTDGQRRLLLVTQGMDTSGKGGTMRKTVGLMDPQGVVIKAFGAPTDTEKRRGFLWRIRQALPPGGKVGVFDRSHYEDVLVARVRSLASKATIERRYDAINEFEQELAESGCVVVKVMLHISRDEQKARLAERLDNPTKYWKYNPKDIDDRKLWDDFQHAYEIALERCNTDTAPWHVIPADRKWYRNLAVAHLLVEHLEGMGLSWPPADFDIEAEKARLAVS
ncbi:PPK2 family polyphosphate kinase [Jiangella gansuensis]|uniref:PPK2 family polyphosphate kinase n=1 Tax=Jiangella gansuensis TaxID=281473 RepID=UPI000478E349|nr:phosphate--nucleotide phosphotransferase [Jiangella gansuensis]